MRSSHKLAIALVAGVAFGGTIIQGLHAQSAPPVYVVVNIDAVTDPEGFKALPAKSGPEMLAPFGGKYVIALRKSPHSMEVRPSGLLSSRLIARKAKAWKASASAKEVDAIRGKTTKSSQFLVEGM